MNIKEYIASGIIEQYVLGLCTNEEAKELEQLRNQYPELKEAILQYEVELEEKMMKDAILPSAEMDEKILRSLEALQTPVIPVYQKTNVRKINWYKTLAAASVLLLVVSTYFIYTLNTKTNKLEQELAATKNDFESLPAEDYKIMKDPSITPVAMYGVGIHSICRCTMFWDKKTGKMYVMIHHLVESTAAKDYQLWAMVDGKPVSVGIINDEIRGRFIELQNVPAGANAFTVTLEAAGGSTVPTEENTFLTGKI
jgi:anti-sigma-K factor RskA